MYKNSQTTSTKCQYQIDISKPRWWVLENRFILKRRKEISKKIVPTITWSPWKPVAIKKDDPKIESEKLKEASQYSHTCSDVKYNPKIIVIRRLNFTFSFLLVIRAWCAHVTVIPEESKMIVFRRGIWNGFIGKIPIGGQILPISMFGAKLLWKNIQKKETKNKISDLIKSSIPVRSPLITLSLWYPWSELSRDTSRHHKKIVIVVTSKLICKKLEVFVWAKIIILIREFIAKKPERMGHGLGEMIWKGWNCLFISVIN